MALNNLGLGMVISAQDFASGSLRRIAFGLRRLKFAAGDATRGLIPDFRAAGLGVSDFNKVLSNSGNISVQMQDKFRKLGATNRNQIILLSRFGKALASLGPILVGLTPLVLGFIGAIVGLRVIKSLTDEFAKFQLQILKVAVLMDDTTAGAAQLGKTTLDLSTKFGFSALDQAAGAYKVVSGGFRDAAQSATVLTAANKLALASVSDVKTAVAALVPTMRAFGIGSDEAEKVADQLFTTVKFGILELNDLQSALGTITATARILKIPMSEILGAIATLTQRGLNATKAATALNTALFKVISPTGKSTKLAQELGIEFDGTALKTKGLVGFFKELERVTGGNEKALQGLFSRMRAARAVIPLASFAMKDFIEITRGIEESSGNVSKASNVVGGALATMENKIKAASDAVSIARGKAFAPFSEMIAKARLEIALFAQSRLPEFMKRVSFAFEQIKPSLQFFVMEFVTFMKRIGVPLIESLFVGIVKFTGSFLGFLGALSALFRAVVFWVKVLIFPIVLIVAAVADLIQAVKALFGFATGSSAIASVSKAFFGKSSSDSGFFFDSPASLIGADRSAAAAAALPGVGGGRGQASAQREGVMSLRQLFAERDSSPIQIRNVVELDGEVVSDSVNEVNSDRQIRRGGFDRR